MTRAALPDAARAALRDVARDGVEPPDGQGGVVAVATSGGRDSIALLHATLQSACRLGLRVVALHVHHGLMAEADEWQRGLEARVMGWAADGWPVQFASTRLRGAPVPGDSVEAWARRERYAALAAMARAAGASLVLLGHHRRDQAETVLLQALRGAGPAGLAAMPRIAVRDGLTWARPWLAQPVEAIDAYVTATGLDVVVDPSNTDARFARSRLRAVVLPALREAFPDAETALAAVARRAHEARGVLDEVAREDLQRIGAGAALPLAAWHALSAPRRANALRAWLAQRIDGAVPESLVRRLLAEANMPGDGTARRWPIDAERGVHAWYGRLVIGMGLPAPAASREPAWPPRAPADVALSLLRCDAYALPGWAGRLEVFATERQGIAPHRLAQVLVRARSGGEQFQSHAAGVARRLKKQYQDAGVGEEGRGGPLLFDADGALLFVAGLGIDARAWAPASAPQWGLRWRACVEGEG